MTIVVEQVVVDCENAAALAGFWSELLGVPVDPEASEWAASVGRSAGSHPVLLFLKVEHERPARNSLHLDLASTEVEADIARAVALGATRHGSFAEYGAQWTTLSDPEGNLFDLVHA